MNFIKGIPYKIDQSYLYKVRESFGIDAIAESYLNLLNRSAVDSDANYFPPESAKESKQYALSEQQGQPA